MQARGLYTLPVRKRGIATGVFLAALLGILAPQAPAQQARPLSPSVVLVLKLVSQDRVQPTTGIVMNNDGVVMVPADFISAGAEIIVLDGGADIIKNGRPADIVDVPRANGWALLRVKGLERPGITLSANGLSNASALHLSAFPPAEYIANGVPPLWADVNIEAGDERDAWSVSAQTPLPQLSGPILDECGYLTGVSLSSGAQSIEPGETPVTLFADGLVTTLDALRLEIPAENCTIASNEVSGPSQAPATDTAREKTESGQAVQPELLKPEVYSPFIQRKRLNPFQGATPPPNPVENRSLWSRLPIWLPLIGLVMFSIFAWKAWFFFRMRRQPATTDDGREPLNSGLQSIVFESEDSDSRIRSAPGDDEQMPDLDALPPACDGVLALQVFVDSNNHFYRFCSVDTQQFDLVIGKTDADINVRGPGIGQRHARLVKSGDQMTLSDLGSGRVTLINGLPCMPGEIMYLDDDADICFGDTLARISIINKDRGSP